MHATVAADHSLIILPIQREFAEAILEGRKRFEFRKVVGEHDPSVVMLYVREDDVIVGLFATGRVVRGTPSEVWHATNGEGTTRERFEAYFEGQTKAIALGVRRFERLRPPITGEELRKEGQILPPNFIVVYPTAGVAELARERGIVLQDLQRARRTQGLDSFTRLELVDFQSSETDWFVRAVTEEIGKWYDDIDISFARSIIDSHHAERDPHGLLTRRKTIHTFATGGKRIGFSVATEKLGGSVKFGPTIISPECQAHGYAPLARRALEDAYRERGFRKAYSTIPDTHNEALKYLLKAGYRVEAHLRAQYSVEHGEFVVGRRLQRRVAVTIPDPLIMHISEEVVVTMDPPPVESVEAFCRSYMSTYYDGLDSKFVESLIRQKPAVQPAEKPKISIFITSADRVVGCCVLIPKRGGAVKMSPLVCVQDAKVMGTLLDSAEGYAGHTYAPRKLYSLVPVAQRMLVAQMVQRGFELEGILIEPYKPSVDMLVLAKFPKKLESG